MKHSIILILIVFLVVGCGETDRPDPDRAGENAHAKPQAVVSAEAIEASLAAAEEYFQTRDLAKAEAILLRLLDRVPEQPHALELYAQLLLAKAGEARSQGDHQQAAAYLNDAYVQYRLLVELTPDSAGLQQSAGEVAHVAGLLDEALEHYTQVQQRSPRQTKAWLMAAQIHIEQQSHEQARALLVHLLEIDADEPLAHASLASIAAEQGAYDEALEHISEARAIHPGDVSFRVMEASIYRRQGHVRDAVQLLSALPQREHRRWFVAEELAAAYSELGEQQRVAEIWVEVFEHNAHEPRIWLAAVRAGNALLALGKREQAWLWLLEAQLLAPDEPQTREFAARFSREDRPE
jgi:tetratricopeptide (TPR) repeat protein